MAWREQAWAAEQWSIGDSVEVPQEWLIHEVNDELSALIFALADLPPFFGGAAMANLSIARREADDVWRVAVKYSLSRTTPISAVPGQSGSDGNLEEPQISYELGGETRHVTDSITSTLYRTWNDGSTVSTAYGSSPIGVTKDEVKGVDIPFPIINFSETHHFPAVKLRGPTGRALRQKWEGLFGKVNDASFRGYPDGEVQFQGVSLQQQGNKPVAVQFKFQRRPTLTDVRIGSLVIPKIAGFSIPDPRWIEVKNDVTKRMTRQVAEVWVHEAIRSADFTDLGISTD